MLAVSGTMKYWDGEHVVLQMNEIKRMDKSEKNIASYHVQMQCI